MNSLTSFQRKLVYAGCMFVLLGPIIWLGLPAASPPKEEKGASALASGGLLAQMRAKHELGETSLGNVDPTSATMNLVLLGMRGVAASHLWHQAIEHQKNKDWAELRSAVDSIILLQPHYIKVWNFQGWNLAYNVSAEWDKVDDRFYWVKEGIKFLQKGVQRNKRHPELYWYVGYTMGQKIGRADEWKQYRGYFAGKPGYPDPEPDPNDPEPDITKRRKRFPKGYDDELNRDGQDNYLVAREWYLLANQHEKAMPQLQHIMANVLFRTYPSRSLTDYAQALQKDGIFEEITRDAWARSLESWIKEYGAEEFDTEAGPIHLEMSDAEYQQLLREERAQGIQNDFKKRSHWVEHYNKMVNFTYWRRRCKLEAERNVDYLVPENVESGDQFVITLGPKNKQIVRTAKSDDPADLVRGLATEWNNSTDPEFGVVRAEPVQEKGPDGKPRSVLKLTWSTSIVQHEPVIKATNGGAKDDQKLVRRVHTRSITEAHRELYEGEQAHFANDFVKAEQMLSSGLQKFQQTLREYPDFIYDDDLVDEIMIALHEWRTTLSLMEEEPPENHPLIEVWRFKLVGTMKGQILAEIDELVAPGRGLTDLQAVVKIMDKYTPLTILLAKHSGKDVAITQEYQRRLKNFTSGPKPK